MIAGIFGISYCGSTLLDFFLGTQPGIKAWGEVHSLADDPVETLPWSVQCSICGFGECSVFTPDFFREARENKARLYRFLDQRSGSPILLVSDKDFVHYQQCGGLDSRDKAVVLFKHPIDAARSIQRRESVNPFYAITRWKDRYVDIIEYLDMRIIPRIFVYLNFFLENPEQEIQRITEFLGTGFDAQRLSQTWKTAGIHRIRGNSDVHSLLDGNEDWRSKLRVPMSPNDDRKLMDIPTEIFFSDLKEMAIR